MRSIENFLYWTVKRSRLFAYHLRFAMSYPTDWGQIRVPITGGQNPFGVHGEWFVDLLRRIYATAPGSFVDVGVNYGQSLLAKLTVDREHGYIGFEPQISCAAYTEAFINANHLAGNHSVVSVGAGQDWQAGELLMTASHEAYTTTQGLRTASSYKGSKVVPIVPGDAVMKKMDIGPVSILKIDVEGGELEVIKGFPETIQAHKPWIIFEVLSPESLYERESRKSGKDEKQIYELNCARADQLFAEIKGLGYSLLQVMPNGTYIAVSGRQDADNSFGLIWNFVAQPNNRPNAFEGV